MFAKDSKGKGLDKSQIFAEIQTLMLKTIEDFSMPEKSDWYNQLGNVISDWADFAVYTDRAI